MKQSQTQLEAIRHTLAHVLAQAVRELYPDAQNAIGPAIENGFYQDFDMGKHLISDTDLPKIEKKMKQNLKKWNKWTKKNVTLPQVKKEFKWNKYKVELATGFAKEKKQLTFHNCGGFIDLCRGGHVDNPAKDIKPDSFKLDKVAGAYWRGDEKNKQLTRIYGLAFNTKKELEEFLARREEAEKRDHKKLGAQLELFMFHHTSPGSPYWLPKGLAIIHELREFWRSEHAKRGYQEISAPLVNKKELWETSGHWQHYKENMFISDMGDGEIYGVKAMNCPNAMLVFDSKLRSYKDLPLRLSDTDILHRYELSGTLNGLLRARSFSQDDSHNFITENQIEDEYKRIFEITKLFYGTFKLDYRFRLGTRPDGFLGDPKTWDKAETTLKKILKTSGQKYSIEEGDGAFYGPKIDILMDDALGREWQMGTIQLDFQQPKRFNLEYTDSDGSKKPPVVIHRVIYGSLERFVGILIEHFAGAFPLWLSPVQVAILPISDKHVKYSRTIIEELEKNNIRLEFYNKAESIGKKIREAEMNKVPYMLIVGDKEIKSKTISVRGRNHKDLGNMKLENLIEKIVSEIESKKVVS